MLEKILEKTKRIGKEFLLSGLLFSTLYFGCTKEDEPIKKEPYIPPKETYIRPKSEQIYEKTFIMNEEILNKINSIGNESISFSESMRDKYGLKEGDIIVGGITSNTPYGILKEVVSISQNQKEVLVRDASLEDAIKEGTIEFDQEIDFSGLKSYSLIEGSSLKKGSGNYDFHLNFDNTILYDKDGNSSTISDQVVLNGDISFNINPKMKFVFKNGIVSSYFGTEFPGTFSFGVESHVGDISLEAEKKLFSSRLNPIIVPFSPVPVVIFPKIEFYLGIKGGTESNFEFGTENEFSLGANISYNSSSGWESNKNLSNSFKFIEPDLKSNLSAKIYLSPRIVFMVNAIAGPYFESEGYLKGEVDIFGNPWWNIYGGLEAKLGLDMNFLSKFIPDFEKTFYSDEKEIANAGGPYIDITNTPPLAAFYVVPSHIGTTSTNFEFNASVSTDKESPDVLEYKWDWENDGIWDTEYSTTSIQSHKFDNVGKYDVNLIVKDPEGLTNLATLDIIVNENSINEIIIQPGPEGKDAGVYLGTYCNYPDDPTYSGSGDDSILEVIYDAFDCNGTKENALISFPLENIPQNTKISSAKIGFYGYSTINQIDQTPTFSLSKLNNAWDESTVKWNTQPSGEKISDIEVINPGVDLWYFMDVTSTVQDWVNGEPNYGFGISAPKNRTYGKIYSSDNEDAEKRPKLIVKY